MNGKSGSDSPNYLGSPEDVDKQMKGQQLALCDVLSLSKNKTKKSLALLYISSIWGFMGSMEGNKYQNMLLKHLQNHYTKNNSEKKLQNREKD